MGYELKYLRCKQYTYLYFKIEYHHYDKKQLYQNVSSFSFRRKRTAQNKIILLKGRPVVFCASAIVLQCTVFDFVLIPAKNKSFKLNSSCLKKMLCHMSLKRLCSQATFIGVLQFYFIGRFAVFLYML